MHPKINEKINKPIITCNLVFVGVHPRFLVGFEDTKGAIRFRISKKNRQHNGQKTKYKRTNNDLQNIHIKLKIKPFGIFKLFLIYIYYYYKTFTYFNVCLISYKDHFLSSDIILETLHKPHRQTLCYINIFLAQYLSLD
jgi:hypothetical protein